MEQNLLLSQRAELEKQLKEELKACRETRRKIGAINLLLGPITEPGSSSQTEPNGDTQAVAFRGVLTKILEKDRREKRKMEAVRGTLKLHRGFFTARTLVEAINNAGFCSVTERDMAGRFRTGTTSRSGAGWRKRSASSKAGRGGSRIHNESLFSTSSTKIRR
jgi:hypothetical protein